MAQLADGGTVIRDGVVEAEATDAEGEALDDEKLALAVQLARPWRISISWHTMRCVPVQFALGRFKTAPEKTPKSEPKEEVKQKFQWHAKRMRHTSHD